MIFTRIPQNYASLARPAIYAFRNDGPPRTLDIEIVEAATGTLLSARRFFRATEIEIDAAPVLRRLVRFAPEEAPATGFRTSRDRSVRVYLRVEGVESPVRTFLPAERPVTGALATSLPRERLTERDAQEELTLLPGAASVEVEWTGGGERAVRTYTAPDAPFPLLFRIRAADFPKAERLTVRIRSGDGNLLATVRYALCDPRPEGVRVAWLSRCGSLEHYTFPVRVAVVEQQTRRTAEGAAGEEFVAAAGEEHITLTSAYEPREMLRALAGIGTAPAVWVVCDGYYDPVEVVPSERTLVRHGTLRAMELTLRPAGKGGAPWS